MAMLRLQTLRRLAGGSIGGDVHAKCHGLHPRRE